MALHPTHLAFWRDGLKLMHMGDQKIIISVCREQANRKSATIKVADFF